MTYASNNRFQRPRQLRLLHVHRVPVRILRINHRFLADVLLHAIPRDQHVTVPALSEVPLPVIPPQHQGLAVLLPPIVFVSPSVLRVPLGAVRVQSDPDPLVDGVLQKQGRVLPNRVVLVPAGVLRIVTVARAVPRKDVVVPARVPLVPLSVPRIDFGAVRVDREPATGGVIFVPVSLFGVVTHRFFFLSMAFDRLFPSRTVLCVVPNPFWNGKELSRTLRTFISLGRVLDSDL